MQQTLITVDKQKSNSLIKLTTKMLLSLNLDNSLLAPEAKNNALNCLTTESGEHDKQQ